MSIPERIEINRLITTDMLCSLIQFIINDHDYVKEFQTVSDKIKLSFGVDLREDNMHGMGCKTIDLILDFKRYPKNKELMELYLKEIVSRFYHKLQHLPFIQKKYHEYCLKEKANIINSFTGEELHRFVNILSNEDLCKLLLALPDNRFIDLYYSFMEQRNRKDLPQEKNNQFTKK